MPPPRRARLSSRPYYSVAAAERSSSTRGWLAVRRNRPSKRARPVTIAQGDEDGTPLTDEILVGIFAGLPDFCDLVRCAATCRRWCRLVSGEAAYIYNNRRRRCHGSSLLRSLALGVFYSHRQGAVPRFAATATASRRLGLRQQPSLNAFVEGLDDGLFDSSRLVASRNGLVVVELPSGKRERTLKLCVCNPMTGEVTVLPSLGGKEIVRPYACTVVTVDVDDLYYDNDGDRIRSRDDSTPRAPSSYTVLVMYRRRSYTACRYYAPDHGRWSPEKKVNDGGHRLGKKQMAAMAGASVTVRGGVVYWYAKSMVFGLRLDTVKAEYVNLPLTSNDPAGNTLVGVSPDGRLRVVQVVEKMSCPSLPAAIKRWLTIAVVTGGCAAGKVWEWEAPQVIEVVGRFLPTETTWMRLRWMCQNSGVVFFTAGCDDKTSEVYAMSLDKQEVEKLASHRGSPSWENLHGYEMDRTSYLSSLAVDEDDP